MAGRTSGLGPSSGTMGASSTVGASVRLGKAVGANVESSALIALVVLEILAQFLLRNGPFKRAHGG